MAEPITIYKLTILNMLDKVDFPLTNTQISNFFLEQDYTDYFRVQQVLSDLEDASLIHIISVSCHLISPPFRLKFPVGSRHTGYGKPSRNNLPPPLTAHVFPVQ